ncbi:MAG: GxxExxY protein [Chitinophaga sp.]|uniref:GxxExxY protein n=1 Tax=Chitinophaga sp. TaxID=1869181 RepID=UPI0025C3160C|nr:GxxExxY protein [Chitinophaga sp.]MBV8255783.1 GxxExxY protein [Chitinophaga sp.]
MEENVISKEILNVCFDIHKKYGPGLFESVYEEILCYELRKRGFDVIRQKEITLVHDEVKLDKAFRIDLLVNEKVLIEIKSVEELGNVHFKQVLTYLKLTNLKLGMLVNFNVSLLKHGIHRIVNGLY